MHEVAPSVPFQTPETMDDVLADSLVFNRMQGWLFSIFAAIALLLALTGIYGVLSQEVGLQTRDIGLRMALGASRPRIVRLVLTRAALLMAAGVVVGVVGSMASRQLLASVIPVQSGRDVVTTIDARTRFDYRRTGRQLNSRTPRSFHRAHASAAQRVTKTRVGESNEDESWCPRFASVCWTLTWAGTTAQPAENSGSELCNRARLPCVRTEHKFLVVV